VPRYTRHERIGVIFFNFNKKKVFNHEEIYFLMRFSNSLQMALENSELFNHLQNELTIKQSNENKLIKLNNILMAISRSSQAMLHAESEKVYIRHICDIITRDCNQTLAWVGFPEGNKMIPRVWSGESQDYLKTLKIRTDRKPYSSGPTSMAIKNKTAYVCNNISEDPDFSPWRKNALEHGINSAVSLPLIHMNVVFGVLNIYSKEQNYYSDDEILLLKELTKYLSKGIITIRLDSARKQAEEALKESEERFRMITEKSNALICELDSSGKVIYANFKYLNIFGSHVPFNNSIVENCKPNEQTGFYNYIYNPDQKNSKNEWSLKDKNNNWRWFRCYPGIFKTSRGGRHFSLMMFDITEIKKKEQQLRENAIDLKELNATKDKFFAIIAHDLKNPFTNLIGASELLGSDSNFDSGTVKRLGKVINNSARRGFNLLQNLLDWSRSQTGTISFNPSTIILNDLIYDCWDYVKAASYAKCQKVEFLISDKVEITADVNMLNTVIRNLMQNAIKFTAENGIIRILVKKSRKNVLVSVEDNGIGISPENLKKLFRIDVKFSQSGTSNETGTGLGLLLCKEFIERHQGKITVKSQPGEGSVFSFSIPSISSTLPDSKINSVLP
jgi:PAS domain S-box-containing protein